MAILPGNPVSAQIDGRAIFLDDALQVAGPGLTVDSGESDSGNTPTYRLRRGTVLKLRTSTGRYIGADDANADAPTAASITADATNPGAGAWDGTLTVSGHWGSVAVTLSGDNTDAAVATAINSALAALNPEWGPAVASVSGSRVVIANRDIGRGTYVKAVHGTVSSVFGTLAVGTADQGTDPDVYVTADESPDLQDINGTAIHTHVASYGPGTKRLDESQLLISGAAATSSASWPETRAIMERQGFTFG